MGKLNKEGWTGKNLLDKIEMISIFLGYGFVIIFMFGLKDANPYIIVTFIIGVAIYVLAFVAFQQYTIRKINERHAGGLVMGGWMDQERGVGAKYKWEIESITEFKEISDTERQSVEAWIKKNEGKLAEFEPEGVDVLPILIHQKGK